MVIKIEKPTLIKSAGNKTKIIEEYVGRVNSKTESVSIAKMKSPSGWTEPAQTPDFDEYTVVLKGTLELETNEGIIKVNEGEAVIVKAGEKIRYSTPDSQGAEYIAVCLPAFSPDTVNRENN